MNSIVLSGVIMYLEFSAVVKVVTNNVLDVCWGVVASQPGIPL